MAEARVSKGVFKLENGTYRARIMINGKPISSIHPTAISAQIWHHERTEARKQARFTGEDPVSEEAAKRGCKVGTVYEEALRWVEDKGRGEGAKSPTGRKASIAITTRDSYLQRVHGLIKYAPLGAQRLDRVTQKELRDFFASLADGTLNQQKVIQIENLLKALPEDDMRTPDLRRTLKLSLPRARTRDVPLSPSTQRQCYQILWGVFDDALRAGRIKAHPMINIERPKTQTKAERDYAHGLTTEPPKKNQALSDDEILALLRIASTDSDRLYARWLLALEIGLRPAEALGLEWPHLVLPEDDGAGLLLVRQQLQWDKSHRESVVIPKPKTIRGERDIPLPPSIVKILKEHRSKQAHERKHPRWKPWNGLMVDPHTMTARRRTVDLVFHQDNGFPFSNRLDSDKWLRLLADAGLPHNRLYVTRHTAASTQLSEGGDLAAISRLLGHSSVAITQQVYTHALPQEVIALAAIQEARHQRLMDRLAEEN